MKTIPATLLSLLVVTAIGCGSDGPSDSTKLVDLSASESKDLCLESIDVFPERMVTCSGQTVTIGLTAADCDTATVVEPTCTATVGQARDCFDAFGALTDAQLCAGSSSQPAACAVLEDC